MTRHVLGFVAVSLAMLPAAPAMAGPVTVNLRIEGPTRTLFEGPVTTDVRPFQFTGDPATHTCEGTSPAGSSPVPVPTRGAAITAASQATPFTMTGTFDTQFQSPSFDVIAGEDVRSTQTFLGEYKNGHFADAGACGDPIANGDEVLFAYGTGSETLLALSGPSTAAPGTPIVLHVTDGANGGPVADATVAGQTSGADGAVTVGPFTARGDQDLKATKPGAIRSNRVRVCGTDGADGACGTTDRRAPLGKILSIREGQRFAKGKGPRTLAGLVASDPSGIADVRLRLTRNDHRRCATFDGRSERFATMKHCGAKRGEWFSVGDREDWSYLLPARLGRGRYVLDVQARDRAGNRDTLLQRTRTRVVFHVS